MTKPEHAARWLRAHRADLLAAALLMLAGALLATLPNWVWYFKTGSPVWIGTWDDLHIYLPVAGHAWHNHPFSVGDPTMTEGGFSMFPWMQIIPGVLTAKLLGLGPLDVGLVWRVFGGLTIPLTIYVLLRHFVSRPWLAAAGCLVFITDYACANIFIGRPFDQHLAVFFQIIRGHPSPWLDGHAMVNQWRVITPGLSWAYLFGYVWLLLRATRQPSPRRTFYAGLALGILFYIYFYFWTGALLGLALAWCLDRERRSIYFKIGCLALLLGLPSLVWDTALKAYASADWLPRSGKFVPVPRFGILYLPKGVLLWLLATGLWTFLRRREFIPAWTLAVAGLMLMNQHTVTALELENYHWMFVWGPMVYLLVLLMLVLEWPYGLKPASRPSSLLRAVLVVWLVVHVGIGVQFRIWDAAACKLSNQLQADYLTYRSQRRQAPPLSPLKTVGGDAGFVLFAWPVENVLPLFDGVTFSPVCSNLELDQREALNNFLSGVTREEFAAHCQKEAHLPGLDRGYQPERIARRLQVFNDIVDRPEPWLDRYHVAYAAVTVDREPAYLATGWRCVQAGAAWNLWERTGSALPR